MVGPNLKYLTAEVSKRKTLYYFLPLMILPNFIQKNDKALNYETQHCETCASQILSHWYSVHFVQNSEKSGV